MTSLRVQETDLLLAAEVEIAGSGVKRARGLLGRASLDLGKALVLEGARQVHTFGMRFPIDVVFCDRSGRVLRVYAGLRPWRVTRFIPRARRAIELASGGAAQVTKGMTIVMRANDKTRRNR